MEIWKDIKDYEGLYQISNYGRVKSLGNSQKRKEKILKPEYSNKDYACVHLRKDGKNKKYRIHRLVAEAFMPNPDNLPCVNHKDENKLNNKVENLEWCTHLYNCHYLKDPLEVYCLDLNKHFVSATEASAYTGICRSSIVKACRDQLYSAGGMLWCYSRDKEKKFPHHVCSAYEI